MQRVASLTTRLQPSLVNVAPLPAEPATDEYVPGISPSEPQRAEALEPQRAESMPTPTYYTSAGVPTAYPTPWTSPPTPEQVRAHYLLTGGGGAIAQAGPSLQQQIDPAIALKLFRQPGTEGGVSMEGGAGDETPWLLIGAGVIAIGAAAYFLTR